MLNSIAETGRESPKKRASQVSGSSSCSDAYREGDPAENKGSTDVNRGQEAKNNSDPFNDINSTSESSDACRRAVTSPLSARPYRGRLAPSPSGPMHLGHAQTFYIAQTRALGHQGQLFLRIEDIDRPRCKEEYLVAMLEDLSWFGFHFSASSVSTDSDGFVYQSKRIERYLAAWRLLYQRGFLYPSRHSRKDVERAISAPHEGDQEIIFPPSLRTECPSGLTSPGAVNWRYRVPDDRKMSFADLRCGDQEFTCGRDFGDFVVWRADGMPSYELAVVVDDSDMGITEVVRGEDLLMSTARQLLLYEALADGEDSPPPNFYHCPLVRDDSGRRLAKRGGATALRALKDAGWTPERVIDEMFQIKESH